MVNYTYKFFYKAKEKITMELKIGDLVEIEDYNGEKIKGLEVGRDAGIFNIKLGYYLDPDFLVSLGYSSFWNREYYYDMFSLTLSHNF